MLSLRRQCELLGLARGSWYYEPVGETAVNLKLMRRIDELYLKRPYFGSRRIADEFDVNRKRVQRLMRVMGLEAIYPKPRTTLRCPEHKIYPYLLRDVEIERPNQVWSTDITYIPLQGGYVYLTAVMDWYSRYVLSWRLSNTLGRSVLHRGLGRGTGQSASRRFSTPIKECSSPAWRSRVAWSRVAWRSAWMVAVGRWTTCSWSACGGR